MFSDPLPIHRLTQRFIDKFWARVTKTETCWLWKGDNRIRLHYTRVIVYRLAYYFRHKVDPYPLDILHSCDNPQCVNPNHLSIGTQADNNKDMKDRGRYNDAIGSNNGHSLLKEVEVANIKWLLQEKYAQWSIAKTYNVHPSTISAIATTRSWPTISPIKPEGY